MVREVAAACGCRGRQEFAAQGEAKSDIPAATEAVDTAFRKAKELVGDYVSAATNAFEDTAPEVVAAFRAGPKIGQSVSRLDAKLTLMAPLAKTHAAGLEAWGEPGAEPRLRAVQVDLRAANTAQAPVTTWRFP